MVTKIAESKHEKFVRLAEKRMSQAVKSLDVLENLSSSSYESNQREREEIMTALQEKVESVKNAFMKQESKEKRRTFVFSK